MNNLSLLNNAYNFFESEEEIEYLKNPYATDDSKQKKETDPTYNLSILNTSIPCKEIVEMVSNAVEYNKKHKYGAKGIHILFYGVSGGGKTNLAQYIADSLGKEIICKYASDILASHVGDTERNIANAFKEASKENKILLFDEADTFFPDRSSAINLWERTQVNELLQQLDHYDGIVIFTTNLKQVMDRAMQRRLHIMVEFKALTPKGIKTLLESYFPDFIFTYKEIERICNYNSVTPGDFGNIQSRLRFLREDRISSQYIIQELCKMQEEKNEGTKKIGFGI